MDDKSRVEMFNEMIQLGYIHPTDVEPSELLTPTGYITVALGLAFTTPSLPSNQEMGIAPNAQLEPRPTRNKKRKRRSYHR